MRRFTLIAGFCIILAACVDTSTPPVALTESETPAPVSSEVFTFTTDGSIALNRNGLNIVFPRFSGWDSFTTADGIVATEKFSSLADRGRLNGLMVYVFVTPLADFPSASSSAVELLSGVADTVSSVQAPVTSTVSPLSWEGYNAAYYTSTDRRTRLQTLILGIVAPDNDALVNISISAPMRMQQKIRAIAPVLLSETTINGNLIGAAAADALPDPLIFPE